MKKNILNLLTLALVGTMFVGCEKEEAGRMTVTFENMNNPKSYIYQNYNCWEVGENIYINGSSRSVVVDNADTTRAFVNNVTEDEFGAALYCFYGGNHNTFDSYSLNEDNNIATYKFEVPQTMTYSTLANGKQKTDSPVVGFTTIKSDGSGYVNNLSMKNVGSMLKFTFNNGSSTNDITVQEIAIYSDDYLAGRMKVEIVPNGNPDPYVMDFTSDMATRAKTKKMTFGTGLALPNATSNSNNAVGENKVVYFPIKSLTNKKIKLMFTVQCQSRIFYVVSPEISNANIAQNQIMPLGTLTFSGNGGNGEGANLSVKLNGTNNPSGWNVQKTLPEIHY